MSERENLPKEQKRNSGTGNRTLGSAVLFPQVMRARNVSHYTIPDMAFDGRRDSDWTSQACGRGQPYKAKVTASIPHPDTIRYINIADRVNKYALFPSVYAYVVIVQCPPRRQPPPRVALPSFFWLLVTPSNPFIKNLHRDQISTTKASTITPFISQP